MHRRRKTNPNLKEKEIAREIYNRTGMPIENIEQVIKLYFEIGQECLMNGFEFPVGEIGKITWRTYEPKENVVTFNPKFQEHTAPHNIPGFKKTILKVNGKWDREYKEATTVDPWNEKEKENEQE